MPRTPHDNSAEMRATAERSKALVAQRKTRLGELLQSTGADGALDFDQIAGLTRLLIELGGLVVKAGLHERVDDDRATLLGGLLLLDDLLRGVDAAGPSPADLRTRWRRRGLRAFDAGAADTAAKGGKREEDASPQR